jgi:phenylacetate-CoA ligase
LLDCNCLRPPREILDALKRYRPQFLHGYSGALAHIAAAATDEDRRMIRPRAVMAGGDALSVGMRRQIQAGFGAPVYSAYGSQELGLIAQECRRSHELHTCDHGVVVEILADGRPAEPGEHGELVGTSLCFYAMPFIRYRLGDLVTAGTRQCPCGRPFGTIREVAGRTTDYLPLPGGRWLHPYQITDVILAQADWVRRHQVVQEAPDAIALHVVPLERPTGAEVRRVEGAVRNALPEDVAFRIVMVDGIARGPGGKYPMARPLHGDEETGVRG